MKIKKSKFLVLLFLLFSILNLNVLAGSNGLSGFLNYLNVTSNLEENTTLIPDYNVDNNGDSLEIIKILTDEEVFVNYVIELAKSKVGCEYSQARREKKDVYDCSSFVRRMYEEITTIYIGNTTYDIPKNLKNYEIDLDEIEPGDLLWRTGHIVMYIGEGEIVHAAGKEYGVVFDNLEDVKPFKKAFRPIDYIMDELEKNNINIDEILESLEVEEEIE